MSKDTRIISEVIVRDKSEKEIIIRTSGHFSIKQLETEFNDRKGELFPGEEMSWDGWKSINGKTSVMKIFYTTSDEKERIAEHEKDQPEKENDGMIIAAIVEGNGFDGMMEFIEKLGKFGFKGVYWAWDDYDDYYYGVSKQPFEGALLQEWAEKVADDINIDDVTVERIVKEAIKIKEKR